MTSEEILRREVDDLRAANTELRSRITDVVDARNATVSAVAKFSDSLYEKVMQAFSDVKHELSVTVSELIITKEKYLYVASENTRLKDALDSATAKQVENTTECRLKEDETVPLVDDADIQSIRLHKATIESLRQKLDATECLAEENIKLNTENGHLTNQLHLMSLRQREMRQQILEPDVGAEDQLKTAETEKETLVVDEKHLTLPDVREMRKDMNAVWEYHQSICDNMELCLLAKFDCLCGVFSDRALHIWRWIAAQKEIDMLVCQENQELSNRLAQRENAVATLKEQLDQALRVGWSQKEMDVSVHQELSNRLAQRENAVATLKEQLDQALRVGWHTERERQELHRNYAVLKGQLASSMQSTDLLRQKQQLQLLRQQLTPTHRKSEPRARSQSVTKTSTQEHEHAGLRPQADHSLLIEKFVSGVVSSSTRNARQSVNEIIKAPSKQPLSPRPRIVPPAVSAIATPVNVTNFTGFSPMIPGNAFSPLIPRTQL